MFELTYAARRTRHDQRGTTLTRGLVVFRRLVFHRLVFHRLVFHRLVVSRLVVSRLVFSRVAFGRFVVIAWLAVGCLAGGSAQANELPAETATYGYPPYDGPADVRSPAMATWIEGMQAVAAAETDPRLRADLLLSAGFALERRAKQADALAHYLRASQTYPPSDPFYGPALVDAARLQIAAGNTAAADLAVRQLESWRLLPPRNATQQMLARVRHAETYLATTGPLVRIKVHVAFARFAAAARAAESLATREQHATRWHRAAVLWFRAERLDDALNAADQGIAVASDASQRTLLRAWRLNAQHNNLVDGELRLTDTWPGDDWNQAALAFVDERAERPLGISYALMFGSQAFGNQKWDEAIAFYERALRYPDVIQRTPDLNKPRRFLTGVSTLMDARRLDAADHMLARIRLVFDNSDPLIDKLAMQIIEQRKAPTHTTPPAPATTAAEEQADGSAPQDPQPPRLLVGPERARPADQPAVRGDESAPTAAPAFWQEPLLWVLIAAAFAVWILATRARRRSGL